MTLETRNSSSVSLTASSHELPTESTATETSSAESQKWAEREDEEVCISHRRRLFQIFATKAKEVRATSRTPTDVSEVILDVFTTCSFAFQLRFNCYPIRLCRRVSKGGECLEMRSVEWERYRSRGSSRVGSRIRLLLGVLVYLKHKEATKSSSQFHLYNVAWM